jgi:hypothetical protein
MVAGGELGDGGCNESPSRIERYHGINLAVQSILLQSFEQTGDLIRVGFK